ncbi:murein L,D-transpeptidase family protein [Qipengyuania sp. MTN3-11]|uniref:L,D-transpeptidase family protein n=1 Tax=Qipengyuania sp. MTN3-11 TaxID=3056557 RepID=UPI0036F42585
MRIVVAFLALFASTACSTSPAPPAAPSVAERVPAARVLPRSPERADFVLIDKSDRTLWAYSHGRIIRVFSGLQFGDAPLGHKQFEGDERTPEGRYTIDYGNPQSRYYLSLHISYPNAADRAYAAANGRSPGGDIFIHGQPNGSAQRMRGDWTDGCIALSDEEIADLWQIVPDGTPIEIRP